MNKIRLIVNNEAGKNEKEKFFIKKELQSILNLYAKMVSNGSWTVSYTHLTLPTKA